MSRARRFLPPLLGLVVVFGLPAAPWLAVAEPPPARADAPAIEQLEALRTTADAPSRLVMFEGFNSPG